MSDFGLFEDIATFDEGKRTASRQVTAAATKRVASQFGAFLDNATDVADRAARLSMVEDHIRQVVAEVVHEYSPDQDVEALQDAIVEHLQGDGVTDINAELEDAPTAVGEKALASTKEAAHPLDHLRNRRDLGGSSIPGQIDHSENHPAPQIACPKCGLESPSPQNPGDLPNCPGCGYVDTGSYLGAASRTADAVSDAGGAVKTEDLPTGNEDALGGPSPEIDKTTWKPNALNDSGNLKPVDTQMDGSPHPTEKQDVSDAADHDKDFLDQTDAVNETQSLPSAGDDGQSTERNIEQPSQAADQWTGTEGLADPVTSSVDPDQNPLRQILNDSMSDSHIEAAIAAFESKKDDDDCDDDDKKNSTPPWLTDKDEDEDEDSSDD